MIRPSLSALSAFGCTLKALLTGIAGAADGGPVHFETQIAPLLEEKCLKCHSGDKPKGNYSIVTRESAFADGLVVPGDPDKGDFYWLIISEDPDEMMPPPDKGGPLADEQKELVRQWITEGANWPDGFKLGEREGPDFDTDIQPILDKLSDLERQTLKEWIEAGAEWPSGNPDTVALTRKIRKKITETTTVAAAEEMATYTETIPESGIKFDLVPIPGGQFLMGSPDTEAKRKADEGPVNKVEVAPFWMGKCEVTWDEYGPFMVSDDR